VVSSKTNAAHQPSSGQAQGGYLKLLLSKEGYEVQTLTDPT
jgi:hypothetical protein